MQPNSVLLVVVVLALAAGLLVLMVRLRRWYVRLPAAAFALVLAMVAGTAVVNDYYGYYQTWGQLSADLTGSYAAYAPQPVANRLGPRSLPGRVEQVALRGARSGITRPGLVYLPPQYFQPQYAHTRFPVVELLHGTPGNPVQWVVQLHVATVADRLIAEHRMGPMILVMPTMSPFGTSQECLNRPGTLDGTYITQDVRTAVLARFRASTDPAQWGIAGYSSGGYCAANLALSQRTAFGAAGIMDGYFRPQDGPAAGFLGNAPAALAANDPLARAQALSPGAGPLPALWLAAGTGNAGDIHAARAFASALHGVEAVPLVREPGAGHNFYAWAPVVPRVLAWMWTQLATPDLRVHFPVSGAVQNADVQAPGASPAAQRARRAAALAHHHALPVTHARKTVKP